jgi:hypothetical protein
LQGATQSEEVWTIRGALFRVRHPSLPDEELSKVKVALDFGLGVVGRFGQPTKPIQLTIFENSKALQRSLDKEELEWLEAWATDQSLSIVRPPASQAIGNAAILRYQRFLAHELLHVVHYQVARIPSAVTTFNDPSWFREGLAVVTASQQSEYMGRKEVAARLGRDPLFSLVLQTDSPESKDTSFFYGACGIYVEELLQDFGDDSIKTLFQKLAAGRERDSRRFHDAFIQTFGLSELQWEDTVKKRLEASIAKTRK